MSGRARAQALGQLSRDRLPRLFVSTRSTTRSSSSSNWRIPIRWARNEKDQGPPAVTSRASLLERTHSLKAYIYSSIKGFRARTTATGSSRAIQSKIPQPGRTTQTPLNISDYARMPLLNPNEKVSDCAELPPIDNEYDQQLSILVSANPASIWSRPSTRSARLLDRSRYESNEWSKRAPKDGQVVVYVVDRKTGAPHANAKCRSDERPKESLTTGNNRQEAGSSKPKSNQRCESRGRSAGGRYCPESSCEQTAY